MEATIAIEVVKALLQLGFAYMDKAGLTEDEKELLIQSERDRFNRNIQTPLPEV